MGTLSNKIDRTHFPQTLANIQIKKGAFKALRVWFSNIEKEVID